MNKIGIASINIILGLILIVAVGSGAYYLGLQKNNTFVSQPISHNQQISTPSLTTTPTASPSASPKLIPKPTSTPTIKQSPSMVPFQNNDYSLEYPSNWYLDSSISTDGTFSLSALPYTGGDYKSAVIQASLAYEDSLDQIIHNWSPTYSTIVLQTNFNTSYAQGKKLITDDQPHKGSQNETISTIIVLTNGNKYFLLHMNYDKGDSKADYFQIVSDQIAKSFKIK